MNCPVDGTQLVMAERQGIEIDYCPSCRGVWLDRGELDKIIERAEGDSPSGDRRERSDESDHDRERGHGRGIGRKKGRRGSFLGELFEFGD